MDEVGAIIVGAEVVGLAIARALALAGHDVMILEREHQFGTITASLAIATRVAAMVGAPTHR